MRKALVRFGIGAIACTASLGCFSQPKPKPAAPSVVSDMRARADRLAADGQSLKDEGAAMNARGQTADGQRRIADGDRKLTQAKMLRDKALLSEHPVPAE